MQTATVTTKAGPYVFGIPEALAEVPLNRYVDFLIVNRNATNGNQIKMMAEAVAAFYGIPSDIIEQFDFSYDPSIDGLNNLFAHAARLIREFTPYMPKPGEDFFKIGEDVFHVPTYAANVVMGIQQMPTISTIEAIEAAETQRQYELALTTDNTGIMARVLAELQGQMTSVEPGSVEAVTIEQAAKKIAKNDIAIEADKDGSKLYSMYVRLMAVLCRKQGEKMPVDDAMRDAWITERMQLFAGVDAATALNVDFFLSNILTLLNKTHPVIGSLTLLSLLITAETQLSRPKRKTALRATMRPFSGASGGTATRSSYSSGDGHRKKALKRSITPTSYQA